MRKNQITISVMEIVNDKPLEYSVYCDSNDFYEALSGAFHQVLEEKQRRDKLPGFGDKTVTYKPRPEEIEIIEGDLLYADADVIVHQVNCQGKMGSGVAKQIRENYPEVYKEYYEMCNDYQNKEELLGNVLFVKANDGKVIANMFAQLSFGYDGKCYTNYPAFGRCLDAINEKCAGKKVAIPYKIACCRGGAKWEIISEMIQRKLNKCEVTLYSYNK